MNAPIPEPNLQPARWRFGVVELDEFRLEILLAGASVPVESKSLELLRVFVRHPGEVLTKDELLDAVWPGRVLSESVLARSVSLLRRAIGDGEQRVIRTVHGYGYRFDAAVERLTPLKTQSPATLHLRAGEVPPLRPNWTLVERLGEGRNETWLIEQAKTRERRVLKFAGDGAGLSTLKREITLQRLLTESLGERAAVVPVLDWNLQEAPYFIETEWCPAGSLERWLGEHPHVPLQTRIELVAQAAEALAAAHGVGVLHKDVKPANLLIVGDAAGRPGVRLADFGSGMLIDDTRLQALSITRLGLTREIGDGDSSGSLMYLAPEVIAGQPATLKSDVYALGVLLYQLIVGDLRRPLAPGWERDVDEPLLREDIAAAAQLDPARRLADAAQLAQRLRALDGRRLQLEHERVEQARADAARRQIERWRAQRGWIAVAFAALAVGLAVSTWLYVDARRARDQAQRAELAAGAVNQFLLDDVLAATDPELSGRPDITVKELLQVAAGKLGDRLQGQPLIEASIRRSLGNALFGFGQWTAAEAQFRRGLQLLGDAAAEQPGLAADLHLQISRCLLDTEAFGESRREAEQARVLADGAGLRALSLAAQVEVARLSHMDNRPGDALAAIEALTPQIERELAANDPIQARLRRYHADLLCDTSRMDECLAANREAVAVNLRLHPPLHPEVFMSRRSMAGALIQAGRIGEAHDLLAPLLADATRALGADHRLTMNIEQALGTTLHYGKDYAGAMRVFEGVYARQRRVLGELHTDTLVTRSGMAYLYSDMGEPRKAIAIYREVLAAQTAKFGERDSQVLVAMHNIGRMLQDLGEWQDAADMQRRALRVMEQIYGRQDHWLHATVLSALAHSLDKLGEDEEAAQLFGAAIAELERVPQANPRYLQRARQWQTDMKPGRA
ncbi:tetratricopeptide repeat protein [Solimonas soli]|uniref:tetratricopeptide repeat protein n=1 Tax=Solimonas soli TaxID=413479 RepID=UPI0004B196FE|nr:tetratricopeptide repeat protein [Solimonas soli]